MYIIHFLVVLKIYLIYYFNLKKDNFSLSSTIPMTKKCRIDAT